MTTRLKPSRQIATCAARIQDPQTRATFVQLHAEATRLLAKGYASRKLAWSVYYQATGILPRAARELLK